MRGLTPAGHPAGGGHGRGRDRAAPVGAQASSTPGPSKGSCHTGLKMATHRGPWGPGREVSRDAWSTMQHRPPCAGMMQAVHKETTGHSERVFPYKRAKVVRQQPAASRGGRTGRYTALLGLCQLLLAGSPPPLTPRGHPQEDWAHGAGPRLFPSP